MTTPDHLRLEDCEQLSGLHLRCLPDSAVTRLGAEYARSFYRYLIRSPREHAFIRRDEQAIDAACILSVDSDSLNRRLWRHTPLMRSLLRPARLGAALAFARALSPGRGSRAYVTRDGVELSIRTPEVILIFTHPARRRRGIAKELLRRCERFLGDLGYEAYAVRVLDDTANPALRFYEDNGFAPIGRSAGADKRFQIWAKCIPSASKPEK